LLALFYFSLNAMFIAVVQILIYAGAIMVLFLFVVTMLSPGTQELERDPILWQRGVAATLGLILVGTLSYLIFSSFANAARLVQATGPNSLAKATTTYGGDVEAFGAALFHGFLFPFEVTSFLIIIAILGALIFGRRTL
jgi:NADH-quinone oxidoreductase subunit J